jgi:transcriptional regulator with XRE-family HTH domain
LKLGLSQTQVADKLGITGAAVGHYETGVSRPSPDRAVRLAKLLGLKPGDIAASERGAAAKEVTRPRPRPGAAKRSAGRLSEKSPSDEEAAVLDVLRTLLAAERRVVVKLLLALGNTDSRARAVRRR